MDNYYHVILETNEKNKDGKYVSVYWFDCKNLNELNEDVVDPYIKQQDVYISGRYVKPNEVRSLTIKLSTVPIDVLVRNAQAKVARNILYVHSRTGIVQSEQGLENITKQLIKERRTLIESEKAVNEPISRDTIVSENNNIFIVHGRDNEAKLEMARFLERAGLKPIVLHEQVSRSNTIIEKIEAYSNVGYAVVLYTPCDVGAVNNSDCDLSPRARQNVVFEHGYFIGKLGRSRVMAFVKGDLEKPNDISGVVYTDLDAAGAWKMTLLRELKDAGYHVNGDALIY